MPSFAFKLPSFGFSGRRPVAGIDLGHREIKGVTIKKGRSVPEVAAVARVSTPAGALDNGSVGRMELLSQALKEVAGHLGIEGQRVVTAAPARHLVVRPMRLPPMPAEEVAQVVGIEAEKILPVPAKDLVLDHIILGETQNEGQRRLDVLLLGLPKTSAYQYYEAFGAAGLRLVAIDAEPLALWRALLLTPAPGPDSSALMLINAGAGFTTVSVFAEGRLLFFRAIPAGGNEATEAVAAAFDVDFISAQKIKEQDGEIIFGEINIAGHDDRTLHLETALRAGLMDLVREVGRSLDFCESQSQNTGRLVGRVFLTGGLARLKGIDQLMAEELGLPVQIAAPPAGLPDGTALDPALSLVVGLALWGVK
ncbi:MAG: type IV pilus assembly protein PilM [Clostridia bacterium]|nr:MAG: type IV pilus assembly protein PilM [Clostridia bacterium]